MNKLERKMYFDVLKSVAIIAVFFYHLGICKFGYLGVDVFLVIAGYFTSQSMEKSRKLERTDYWNFILNRVFRLLPLLLIVSVVCLFFGWQFMLPDDYENLAQSVVATNFFANNILQGITTSDYWAVVNEYKPLMHTWYVGLLMQFYVIIVVLFAMANLRKGTGKNISISILSIIGIISLLMYLFVESTAEKFYYLPFRLFEFCAGGLVFYFTKRGEVKSGIGINTIYVVAYFCLVILLFVEMDIINNSVRLLFTVIVSTVLLYLMPTTKMAHNKLFSSKIIAVFGISSYSIFVWHQVVFALTRYSFTDDLEEGSTLLIMTSIIAFLSYLSYRFVEKLPQNKIVWIIIITVLVLTTGYSLVIYKNAGVVRNVPELEVVKGKAERGQWAAYCDRGYLFDKDFTSTDKLHWFIIGNSFGRDWVNIILESSIVDKVEVSYTTIEKYANLQYRFEQADIVFISFLGIDEKMIEDVKKRCRDTTKFYIIGEKNFGVSNGQVYRKRNSSYYLQSTTNLGEGYAEKNERLKNKYSDIYIDMIEVVRQSDGKVKVFSDDGRYISQDCAHLTRAGAQYYAKMIDWSKFLK